MSRSAGEGNRPSSARACALPGAVRDLAQSPDESERRPIQQLLAEEEAKERKSATRADGAAA